MKSMKRFCVGLALGAMLTQQLAAQAPPPPPPPPPGALLAPPPPAGAPGTAPPPAAAPAGNIWSFFCMTPEQKLACKQCFCNSIFGKMITGILTPVSVFSGGLL